MPYLSQVAAGIRQKLTVFGDDYETEDGSCERDCIHVDDLAYGHVCALSWLIGSKDSIGYSTFNLGINKPTSVFQLIKEFEQITGAKVPFTIGPRRQGDLAKFWANSDKAKKTLGWEPKLNLTDMIEDTWRWQRSNT